MVGICTGLWSVYGRYMGNPMVSIWSVYVVDYGQYMDKNGQYMVGIWAVYGQYMFRIWTVFN